MTETTRNQIESQIIEATRKHNGYKLYSVVTRNVLDKTSPYKEERTYGKEHGYLTGFRVYEETGEKEWFSIIHADDVLKVNYLNWLGLDKNHVIYIIIPVVGGIRYKKILARNYMRSVFRNTILSGKLYKLAPVNTIIEKIWNNIKGGSYDGSKKSKNFIDHAEITAKQVYESFKDKFPFKSYRTFARKVKDTEVYGYLDDTTAFYLSKIEGGMNKESHYRRDWNMLFGEDKDSIQYMKTETKEESNMDIFEDTDESLEGTIWEQAERIDDTPYEKPVFSTLVRRDMFRRFCDLQDELKEGKISKSTFYRRKKAIGW